MTQTETLQKAFKLLNSAKDSLSAAQELLNSLAPEELKNSAIKLDTEASKAYEENEQQIVEGVFDGQSMIGPNGKIYPVAANYASKSKLVTGDRLKLTIMPNGSFLYKQIAPIARRFVKGILVQEDGHFKVSTDEGSYRVLLASVTYYKGNIGDEVTLTLPEGQESSWGAIEAIIPQIEPSTFDEASAF